MNKNTLTKLVTLLKTVSNNTVKLTKDSKGFYVQQDNINDTLLSKHLAEIQSLATSIGKVFIDKPAQFEMKADVDIVDGVPTRVENKVYRMNGIHEMKRVLFVVNPRDTVEDLVDGCIG